MFSQLPDIEGGTKRRGDFTSDVSIDGSANEGLAILSDIFNIRIF
jgi:hypothetical protein